MTPFARTAPSWKHAFPGTPGIHTIELMIHNQNTHHKLTSFTEDSVAVVVIEHKYVVGATIRLNGESTSEITERIAGWLCWIESRCVNRVRACGDGSWCDVERFAVTLSLLVEVAFDGGN